MTTKTTFSSPHWLSDEQIRELGIADHNAEAYRRYHYQQSFGVETWYEKLGKDTFETQFVPLTAEEVQAILRVNHSLNRRTSSLMGIHKEEELLASIQISVEDTDTLKGLEDRLNGAITSFGESGAFIKLNTRSPKDVCVDSTRDFAKVNNLIASFECFLLEGRELVPDTLLGQFTDDEVMSAFVKACTSSMRVTQGDQAIDLLLESTRVQQDLTKVENFGLDNVTASVVVRKWNEHIVQRNHMEFRGFVYKNQLNAVTQYDELTFYQDIFDNKKEIEEKILSFFKENVQKQLESIESYVIDFFVDEDRVYVIELNPFHNGAGAGLFSWREDRERFMNGPFELRILEESAEDPLRYLSTFWERKLKQYIKKPAPEEPEESNSTLPSKTLFLGATTIAILAIAGGYYWTKRRDN